ncbi:MAG TPA: glycosyltransferase family 39 protein, partial [Herpetosiphonaceae bacterium]
ATPRDIPAAAPARSATLIILGGALALAAAARLIGLDAIPLGLWRDEARYGLAALRILRDPSYRPVYLPDGIDYPGLLMYLTAAAIKLIGVRIETVRLVAAVAGTLTPVALYAFGRHIAGRRAALSASVMVAVSAWHIALSRISFVAVLEPFLTMGGLALLWSALHLPKGSRQRWLPFASAGLSFGLALYTYHTARILPALLLLLLLTALGRSAERWRAALPGVLLMGAVLAAVVAPLASYAVTNADDFNLRMGETALLRGAEEQAQSPVGALNENLRRYALMWHLHGEPNARHYIPGRPMLDPIIGACFLIGLLLPLATPERRFLAGWLALELVPALLAEGAPHAVRAVGTIAPALLLAGIGLEQCLGLLADRYRRPAAGAALAIVVIFNLNLYFRNVPFSPAVWDRFYVPETAMADYARTTAPAAPVMVPRDLIKTDVGAYLLDGVPVQTWSPNTPLAAQPAQTQILVSGIQTEAEQVWVNQNLRGLSPTAGARYPGTERPVFWIYTLP